LTRIFYKNYNIIKGRNKKFLNMILKEITPKEYQCAAAACPAIFEITPKEYQCAAAVCPSVFEKENKLIIIGNKVNNLKELELDKRVGKDEDAIMVDREMLRQIFEK
jgi:hypothetical protein